MKTYAIIIADTVANIAIALEALGDNWIDVTDRDPIPGIGWEFVSGNFIAPPAPPPVPIPSDPYEWLIDIGPYMDRFGAGPKMDVLTSTNAVVKAIIQDMMGRKYIDLKRADAAQGLAAIGSIIPSVTPALQAAIRTVPVTNTENVWLRNTKVFG